MKKFILALFLAFQIFSYSKEFRIMTYNIYGGRLTNPKEISDGIKKYEPDYIALQEVDKNTIRSSFKDFTKEMADNLGYKYYYFQKALDYQNGEFGISVISKYPIKNLYIHELPSTGAEKRQVIVTKLNDSLCIVNTHLGFGDDNKKQVLDLLKVIDYVPGEEKIVCGDFNLTPDTQEYSEICKEYIDTYNEKSEKRIDYIFLKKGENINIDEAKFVNVKNDKGEELSDHRPYIVKLNIKHDIDKNQQK